MVMVSKSLFKRLVITSWVEKILVPIALSADVWNRQDNKEK
jgi:hypothetical protein